VRCAILAPSSHNSQPWLFRMSADIVEVWADRSRQLRVCDPEGRELVMSCGAALLNLRVACHRFSRESTITLLPDGEEPDLLAYAGCGHRRPCTPEDRRLFEALFRRRTCRHPFEARAVPADRVEVLVKAAEREGAYLVPIEEDARPALHDLVEAATHQQFRDRQFRAELASWLRVSARRPDGMPNFSLGLGRVVSRIAPWLLRGVDISGSAAARERELAQAAPVLAVLVTDRDSPIHWLRAGQALERVLLAATAEGLSASYLNSPVQVADFRASLAQVAGCVGFPQVVLRFGYAGARRPTARRPLADVIKPLA
jgi:nitroreductase